jgi:hypothetical protein
MTTCIAASDGAGAVICTGPFETLGEQCLTQLVSEAAMLISNPKISAPIQAGIGVLSADDLNPLEKTDLACTGIANRAAFSAITVDPPSAGLQLGESQQFTTSSQNVTWSILGDVASGNSLGTITQEGFYTAPSQFPSLNYCGFELATYANSCPITIIAKDPSGSETQTPVLLTVGSATSTLLIFSLSPSSISAGSADQWLSINGAGFLPSDIVRFNGSPRNVQFISTDQWKIYLSKSDLASVGSYTVTVDRLFPSNPGLGGLATLTVTTAQTTLPQMPAPTSPGTPSDTGFPVTSTMPTLQWTGAGASLYKLTISESPNGTSSVYEADYIDGGKTSWQIPPGFLKNGVSYRWNLQAYDIAGWSAVSPYLYFTVTGQGSPTGTLSLSALLCVIPAGGSSCSVNARWSTTNPVNTSAITSDTPAQNTPIAQGNSNNAVPVTVLYPSRSFFLINNLQTLATATATASCISGTTWNGTVCQAAPMSGTLTLASPSCTIQAGASTCTVGVTWTTTNPVATSAVTSTYQGNPVGSGNNGSVQGTVPHAGTTFYLYNDAVLLAQSSATASCISGTTWNGSTCH